VSLTARHLEANGIPTVIIGSARDIVEECGVPRFLLSDFPLGNPCGSPWDRAMQAAILQLALDLVESARFPRTTVQTPYRWPVEDWRANYMRVDESNRALLRRMGEERRARRERQRPARARSV
jgi:hypothetical protein